MYDAINQIRTLADVLEYDVGRQNSETTLSGGQVHASPGLVSLTTGRVVRSISWVRPLSNGHEGRATSYC